MILFFILISVHFVVCQSLCCSALLRAEGRSSLYPSSAGHALQVLLRLPEQNAYGAAHKMVVAADSVLEKAREVGRAQVGMVDKAYERRHRALQEEQLSSRILSTLQDISTWIWVANLTRTLRLPSRGVFPFNALGWNQRMISRVGNALLRSSAILTARSSSSV